jgi:hypothetical protein
VTFSGSLAILGCVEIVASHNCGKPLTLKASSHPTVDILSPPPRISIKGGGGDDRRDEWDHLWHRIDDAPGRQPQARFLPPRLRFFL